MIFKVGGQRQRSAQGAVERCGDCVSPGSKRSTTGGDRERGIACGPRIELETKRLSAKTDDRWGATHRNCSMDNW